MPPKKNSKEDKKDFKWTDDKVELLLNVSNEYKVSKASESVDWESVKSKYSDIYDLFVAALPDDDSDIMRSFPHRSLSRLLLQS